MYPSTVNSDCMSVVSLTYGTLEIADKSQTNVLVLELREVWSILNFV